MKNIAGLDLKIKEMAERIKELREIEGLTVAEMAVKTGVSEQEYVSCENGLSDLNFAFIYRCAAAFNVDVTDIIAGQSPKLKSYTLTRSGNGQKIEQAHGMTYYNLAASSVSSGTSANLCHLLKAALKATEVGKGNHVVGTKYSHYTYIVEVQPFGYHLCAYKYIDVSVLEVGKYFQVFLFLCC